MSLTHTPGPLSEPATVLSPAQPPTTPPPITPAAVPKLRSRSPFTTRVAQAPPTLIFAWIIIAVVLAWALLPHWFAPHSAYEPVASGLLPPSLAYPFGTDAIGRDQLSRVIFGAHESLLGATIAVLIGAVVGTLLGALAGSLGGAADSIVMRCVDVLLAVPGLLLALTVVVLLGPGTVNAAIAVGIGAIAGFARLVRSEVIQVRQREYVEAAYGSGGSFFTVLARHILPNSLRPLLALLALQFGGAILALSTLGFLGYGVTPPDPEWGMLIAQGRNLLGAAWWVTVFPGVVLLCVVLAANRISWAVGRRTS